MKLKILTSLSVFFCITGVSISASITTALWTETDTGDWAVGTNWNSGSGPAPDQDAIAIFDGEPSVTSTVTFSASQTVDVLQIKNSDSSFKFELGGVIP